MYELKITRFYKMINLFAIYQIQNVEKSYSDKIWENFLYHVQNILKLMRDRELYNKKLKSTNKMDRRNN